MPVHIGGYLRQKYFFRHLKRLPVGSFQRVLDAGCGNGVYSFALARKYSHLTIVSYDINSFDSWKNPPKNITFQQLDLSQMQDKDRYDFCLCIDVMEHIPNNRMVMERIHSALKPGGYFFLHIPRPDRYAKHFFPERLYKEFEEWSRDEHIGKRYSIEEIREILASIGFDIATAHCTFNFWGRLAWELDRITDRNLLPKVILTPFMKLFATMDIWLPKSTKGAVLVIAQKPLHKNA